MRETPLTRGGASSICSVAPALEAVNLKKLIAKKARKAPETAPDDFVPARWRGYRADAIAIGDSIAYRHFWELTVLLGAARRAPVRGRVGARLAPLRRPGFGAAQGHGPKRGRILAGAAHSAGAGPLIRCRLAGREELDKTGGDGGGIPARQVVARIRYRHRVDFWNPLLQ